MHDGHEALRQFKLTTIVILLLLRRTRDKVENPRAGHAGVSGTAGIA
jgi:hypothetical protein